MKLPSLSLRQTLLWFHRYVGLFMALWLIIIGITGSIIVFNPELEHWLTPGPYIEERAQPELGAVELNRRAQASAPHAMFNSLTLYRKPHEAYAALAEPRVDPATGQPYELGYTMIYFDPFTGAELGRDAMHDGRIWPVTRHNVLDLINQLHYQLAIPGGWGTWLFGIVALLWTVDCFASVVLTFPLRARRDRKAAGTGPQRKVSSWVKRWWNPSWLIKVPASTYRVNLDLHRAGGLWLWLVLFALAWSGVGFNLGSQVYSPVMKALFGMPDPYGDSIPTVATPNVDPSIPWPRALETGRHLMAEVAAREHFVLKEEDFLLYMPDKNVYLYLGRSDRDLWDEYGMTTIVFRPDGSLVSSAVPTGSNLGATINTWIFSIHMAKMWGMPFRIFIVVMGLVVAVLSGTGVYLWWKKRRARQHTVAPKVASTA